VRLSAAPFPILELAIRAEMREPLQLPQFAGSMLRGAYGTALRRLACMTGLPACAPCPLRQTCPFPALFEPPPSDLSCVGIARAVATGTPPYVILPPADGPRALLPGHCLEFGMRLFGQAVDRLPFVIQAWRQALRRGLGKERARAELVEVFQRPAGTDDWALLYEASTGALNPPLAMKTRFPAPIGPNGQKLTLRLLTPLRLVSNGIPLKAQDLTPRRIVGDIVRRARAIAAQAGSAEAQAEVAAWPVEEWLGLTPRIESEAAVRWRDWRRYSNRQKQGMTLGGLVGEMTWRNVAPEVASLLELGALIHVGKECVFGFGRMEIAPGETPRRDS